MDIVASSVFAGVVIALVLKPEVITNHFYHDIVIPIAHGLGIELSDPDAK